MILVRKKKSLRFGERASSPVLSCCRSGKTAAWKVWAVRMERSRHMQNTGEADPAVLAVGVNMWNVRSDGTKDDFCSWVNHGSVLSVNFEKPITHQYKGTRQTLGI